MWESTQNKHGDQINGLRSHFSIHHVGPRGDTKVPGMTLRSLHLVAGTFALLLAQWLNTLLLILFKFFMHVYIGFWSIWLSTHSSPAPSLPSYYLAHPISYVLLKPTQSTYWCLDVSGCGTIYWSLGSLSGVTSLKSTHSLPVASWKELPSLMLGLHKHLSLSLSFLCWGCGWLGFVQVLAARHRWYEFIRAPSSVSPFYTPTHLGLLKAHYQHQ